MLNTIRPFNQAKRLCNTSLCNALCGPPSVRSHKHDFLALLLFIGEIVFPSLGASFFDGTCLYLRHKVLLLKQVSFPALKPAIVVRAVMIMG